MSGLYCSKDGKSHWDDDQTVYNDGSFELVTRGPLIASLRSESGNVHPCVCDSCNREIRVGEEAFLSEIMMNPHAVQCSQAGNYFELRKVECRLCGVPKSDVLIEVLFHPADDFEDHYEYVERICRSVQHARQDDEGVGVVLSLVIDEEDPYREFWKFLGEDENGKLSPQEIERRMGDNFQ